MEPADAEPWIWRVDCTAPFHIRDLSILRFWWSREPGKNPLQIPRNNYAKNRMRETSFLCVRAKSLQSCLTLCDPMDCSPPGSYVHGILQARILEWVAMPSWFLTQGSNPNLLCLLHWQVSVWPRIIALQRLGFQIRSHWEVLEVKT